MLSFKRHFVILISFLLILSLGCNKEDVEKGLVNQREIIVSLGQNQRVWQMQEISISGVKQPLTPHQQTFKKTFFSTGRFTDTDSNEGSWEIPSLNVLTEKYENLPSGSGLTQTYQILNLSPTTLIISYVANNQTVVITFYAV